MILNASSFISGAISFFDVTSQPDLYVVTSFCAQCSHMKEIDQLLGQMKVQGRVGCRPIWYLVFQLYLNRDRSFDFGATNPSSVTISQLGTVLSIVLTQLGKLPDGSEFVNQRHVVNYCIRHTGTV